jgi:dolichol-phosphate mannosyltransferase
MTDKSTSVFIPAYNEEQNIQMAVESVKKALAGEVSDWEIIIVDDGSSDDTSAVCEKLKKKNPKIKVINHQKNSGLGESLRTALKASRKKYFTIFPGDNDMSSRSLKCILKEAGKADIVMGYIIQDNLRSFKRQLLSRLYVIIMNFLFCLRLRYFNGSFICLTSKLSDLILISPGMDIIAEIKIKLIKEGVSYREIAIKHSGRKFGQSKAYTFKNIYFVLTNTFRMFFSVYFPK